MSSYSRLSDMHEETEIQTLDILYQNIVSGIDLNEVDLAAADIYQVIQSLREALQTRGRVSTANEAPARSYVLGLHIIPLSVDQADRIRFNKPQKITM